MPNAAKTRLLKILSVAALVAPVAANANCWGAASESYGIPVKILKAVAKTESGFNAGARNRNKNGTHDIGFMQINSSWLPVLGQYGINEESLNDSCTNLKVGAWILSNNARKLGWNWAAIGAYNVGCAKLDVAECSRRRNQYAWKIHAALSRASEIRDEAPVKTRLANEQGATPVSSHENRSAEVAPQVPRIMVFRLGTSEQPSPMQIAQADLDQIPRGLSVGGFLNYADTPDE